MDLPLIEKKLKESSAELSWLYESYRSPLAFWQALKNTPFSPLRGKSVPWEQYDFYNDLINRYQQITTPALRWYDSVLGWQKISYRDLGVAASKNAALWLELGVQPGQILCIIYPFGLKYVVSLLAALKIGLTVSFLPPQGRGFLQRRLKILNPDYIITEEIYASVVGDWLDRLLPEQGSAKDILDRSYTYPSGSVLARCFDPASRTPHIPRELTSDAAYLCPLRDGMIALGLRPGQTVAAPGFHFLETYPGLILASLLNGGTYLHLEPEDIAKNPKLLIAYPLSAIGISSQVRDILLHHPVKVKERWRFWFKNPAESFDLDQWQAFIRALELEEVLAGNLKWETSWGGCSLFSIKRKGVADFKVLPSAGVPWSLTDVSGNGAVGDYGLFSPAMMGEKEQTPLILARSQKEWLLAGSLVSGRAGRTYPITEVLETIRFVCPLCSIVKVPASGGADLFILLVFTGAKTGVDEAGICKKIRHTIERQMGQEFLPDRIQCFFLFPRYDSKGEVDHDWIQSQYLRGSLFRKSQDEIYQCLTTLRGLVN